MLSPLTDLLQSLIRIQSCDPPGGELAVARHVSQWLTAHGIAHELDEFLPGRANVLARIKGQGHKPPLVFSAHLDTVPPGQQPWQRDPFSGAIEGDLLHGRGASDMKSGVAAMAMAAVEIAKGPALEGDLLLAFSAGESANCIGAKRFVERRQLADASALIVSEPSSLGLITAEMGVLWLRLHARGRQGHVSGDRGANAILMMADALQRLKTHQPPTPHHNLLPMPSINIGCIMGGSAVNVSADSCVAEIDVRLRPGTAPETVVAEIAALAGHGFKAVMFDFKPAVETPTDHPLVTLSQKVLNDHGFGPAAPQGVAYYSDATILTAAHGTPFVIIGPGELGLSGQPDEYVHLSRVEKSVGVFVDLARRWMS
jgi:succinyl-diaminopimelate desuccinylase